MNGTLVKKLGGLGLQLEEYLGFYLHMLQRKIKLYGHNRIQKS